MGGRRGNDRPLEKRRGRILSPAHLHMKTVALFRPNLPLHTYLGRKTLSAPIGRFILLHISFLCVCGTRCVAPSEKEDLIQIWHHWNAAGYLLILTNHGLIKGGEGERRGRKEIHFIDRVTLPLLREQKKDLSWVKTLIYG